MDEKDAREPRSRRPFFFLILGLYLTLRGYHSLDNDQAYRLPLLLHRQDPALYADDPFVRAFDDFNPHRGSLVLLDAVTRLAGLSPGLLVLFLLTFLATCWGIERLARVVWSDSGTMAGRAMVAVVLVLMAKAGNIGTNHLFEAMVLDRLMGLALAWVALAILVSQPERGWWASAVALGGTALIHPSLGLQIGLVTMGSWVVWSLLGSRGTVTLSLIHI